MLGLRWEQRSPPRRPPRGAGRARGSQDSSSPAGPSTVRTNAHTQEQASGGGSEPGCCLCKRAAGTPCTWLEGSVSRRPGPLFKPARVGRRSPSTSFWFFQENRLRSPKEAFGRQKLPSEMRTQKKTFIETHLKHPVRCT